MKDDGLSEVEIEQLLVGSGPHADVGLSDLAEALAAIRAEYVAPDLPPVGVALREFVDLDLIAGQGSLPAASAPGPVVQVTRLPRRGGFAVRRRRAVATVSTFLGTLAGKIALGASVAMAATGGAHIAGVVDVPGLPDIAEHRISEEPDLPDDVVIDLDELRVDTTTAGTVDGHRHDQNDPRPDDDEPVVTRPDDDPGDDDQGEDPAAEDPDDDQGEDPVAEDPDDDQDQDPVAEDPDDDQDQDPAAEDPDDDQNQDDEGDDDQGDDEDEQASGTASLTAGGGSATASAGGGTGSASATSTATAGGSTTVTTGSGGAGVTAGGSATATSPAGTVTAGGDTNVNVDGGLPGVTP